MSQVHAATHPGMLGSYDLCERLGIGGLGELWRAYDRARGLEVALKILAADRAASAAVRVRRIGVGGTPQAPWWIAMGCAGLAAAALGSVLEAGVPWPAPVRMLLAAAMCTAEIFAAALCVPVAAASVRFLLGCCRYRDMAAWPPMFSTAVFALGGLATGKVLQLPVFARIGLGAGASTLVFWLVTACWNASGRLRGRNAISG